MSPNQLPESTTLEQVKLAFDQWRQERKNPSERTPTHLVKKTVLLAEQYPQSEIINTLELSYGQYKKWLKAHGPKNETMSFVALPGAHPRNDSSCARLTIAHPNGIRLEATGLSASQLTCLVNSFMGQVHA
jgi:hypothetical protein